MPLVLLYCSGEVARASFVGNMVAVVVVVVEKPVLEKEREEASEEEAEEALRWRRELRASRGVRLSRDWYFSARFG